MRRKQANEILVSKANAATRIWFLLEQSEEWDTDTVGKVALLLVESGFPIFTPPGPPNREENLYE